MIKNQLCVACLYKQDRCQYQIHHHCVALVIHGVLRSEAKMYQERSHIHVVAWAFLINAIVLVFWHSV